MSDLKEKLADAIDSVAAYVPGSHADDYINPDLAADAVLALLESEGYARRADVLEEAADAYDRDAKLFCQLEKRSLASEGRDVDGIQDIGAAWLRALATPPTEKEADRG